MNIPDRIAESERLYNERQASRQEHLRLAEEDATEMLKLQGEWRVLQELLAKPKGINKKATAIAAVPDNGAS